MEFFKHDGMEKIAAANGIRLVSLPKIKQVWKRHLRRKTERVTFKEFFKHTGFPRDLDLRCERQKMGC